MRKLTSLIFITTLTFIFLSCGNSNDGHQDKILGTWYTIGKRSTIEIYKEDGKYFGKIVDLKRPFDREGNKKKDFRNPDPAKQGNLLIGTKALIDLEYDGDKVWSDGKYYDHRKGQLYDCTVTMTKEGDLKVKVDGKERDMIWRANPEYIN